MAPENEFELLNGWGEPDSVWLGYEVEIDDPGGEGDLEAGYGYTRRIEPERIVRVTHWYDVVYGWLPIEGPWSLCPPDLSEGEDVQSYAELM